MNKTIFGSLFFCAAAFAGQSVIVTNNSNQPVPVTGNAVAVNPSVATPEPAIIQLGVSFAYDAVAPKTVFNVPAGKRLVIENISARCQSYYATNQDFVLRLGAGQSTDLSWLHVPAPVVSQGFLLASVGATSMPVRAQVDYSTIWVDGERSIVPGLTSCVVTILGYYTPTPTIP